MYKGIKMTTLIVGASGKTGRLLVENLLNRGEKVKVIVRSVDNLSAHLLQNKNLTVIKANVLDLTTSEMNSIVEDCDAISSCLGHNMNFKGIYGNPRRLVTDVASKLCTAINFNNPSKPIKYLLMNTIGNSNRDLSEEVSFGEKSVIGIIRLLLPPHVDNEEASDYLRTQIGQESKNIEWVAVRPDSLINEEYVGEYNTYPSPISSAIFGNGKTSRINVANFMAELITQNDIWDKWKGKMPVIYNKN